MAHFVIEDLDGNEYSAADDDFTATRGEGEGFETMAEADEVANRLFATGAYTHVDVIRVDGFKRTSV